MNHERTGCNVIIERVTTIIEVEILYIFVKVFVFGVFLSGDYFFKDLCPQPDFLLFLMWCAWCVPGSRLKSNKSIGDDSSAYQYTAAYCIPSSFCIRAFEHLFEKSFFCSIESSTNIKKEGIHYYRKLLIYKLFVHQIDYNCGRK